jgi:hypothetical protein
MVELGHTQTITFALSSLEKLSLHLGYLRIWFVTMFQMYTQTQGYADKFFSYTYARNLSNVNGLAIQHNMQVYYADLWCNENV